jgi:membrane protease subunit (stomatin/prohibitin family)
LGSNRRYGRNYGSANQEKIVKEKGTHRFGSQFPYKKPHVKSGKVMGILDFLGKQFIDVIEWTESVDGVLAYRYPMRDQEIQNGAQLTVRETQLALFVNEGTLADLFSPGLHTLNTKTLPILTNVQNWDKFFASPFKSDLYFFSTRLQLDQKWGTPTPITVRDKEFGVLRIRAYGNFSYHLEDPRAFYLKVSGSREQYSTGDLDGQLKAQIATALATALGGSDCAFIDMAANQGAFSATLAAAVAPLLAQYGLKLDGFQVESISLPEELQKRLDERAGAAMVGDLGRYAQFQAAASIPIAAANPGGVAGAGAGIGAGLAMGQMMAQSLGVGAPPAVVGAGGENPLETIEKLHDLHKKGVLTESEFNAKKAELLKKL